MIQCLILKSQITSFFFCLYIFTFLNSKETEHVDTQTYVKIKENNKRKSGFKKLFFLESFISITVRILIKYDSSENTVYHDSAIKISYNI